MKRAFNMDPFRVVFVCRERNVHLLLIETSRKRTRHVPSAVQKQRPQKIVGWSSCLWRGKSVEYGSFPRGFQVAGGTTNGVERALVTDCVKGVFILKQRSKNFVRWLSSLHRVKSPFVTDRVKGAFIADPSSLFFVGSTLRIERPLD